MAAIRTWKEMEEQTHYGTLRCSPGKILDRYAFYNSEMDEFAKERWNKLKKEGPKVQQKNWYLGRYIRDRKVSKDFIAEIHEQVSGSKARQYWNNHKQCFGEGSIDDVELSATADALKSMIIVRHHWLTKHTSGFNAVGKNMSRRKEWLHSKYPRCDYIEEDSAHVIRCQGTGASSIWERAIKELERWLKSISTAENIIRAICLRLESWITEQPMITRNFSQPLQSSIIHQTQSDG